MWHEARKQEKIIRGMIVDYRRRAERRKDFYEKIKAEPTQFLQLHGRPCKIHLDPAIAAAGEGPAIMMPWQGDPNNLIDRFDGRAHLDFIPEVKNPEIPPEELTAEERQCNYERYRILAQNAFLGIGEDKFLQQLAIEEQFGVTIEEKEMAKEKLNEKKGTGAAIGYNYNDPGAQPSSSNGPVAKKTEEKERDSEDDSDLEIIDVDLSIDVNKMEPSQAHELNAVGPLYGMAGCDLFSFLTGDADDAENQKQLLREEKEKAMFSGRKSRRERRAHRDKKLATRVVSPPSYAAPQEKVALKETPSRSPSRSPSPEGPDSIQFITSFGGEDEEKPKSPAKTYADKLKKNLKRVHSYSEVARKPKPRFDDGSYSRPIGPRGPPSRSRSRSNSKPRSRSRSRSRYLSRSISRSKSRSRSLDRRSRSRSYSRRSMSRSRSRSGSLSRSRSRSKSRSRSRSRSSSRSHNYRRRSRSPANNDSEQKPLPRYYGRRKEDKSSSELSLDSASSDDDNKAAGDMPNANQTQTRSGPISKGPSRETLTLKEKLRRKMQAQLSRQLAADQRAAAARAEREQRRLQRRDRDLRTRAIQLRRKQREMRHQQNRRSSDDGSDRSRSGSSSRDSPVRDKKRSSKSRSKSRSPDRQIPVWESNREPPAYRSKYDVEVPNHPPPLPRRRYDEDRSDDKPNYPRYDDARSNHLRYDKPREREGHYERPYAEPPHRDYHGSNRDYEGSNRDYQGSNRDYQGSNRDYHDNFREYNYERRDQRDDRQYPQRSYRGGYRGQGHRGHQASEGQSHRGHPISEGQGYRNYNEGQSHKSYGSERQWTKNDSNGESSGQSKNRIKLVDY